MVKLIIWDSGSTNFDANEFVRKNGTEQIKFATKEDAIKYSWSLPTVERHLKITIEDEDGNRSSAMQFLSMAMKMIESGQLN